MIMDAPYIVSVDCHASNIISKSRKRYSFLLFIRQNINGICIGILHNLIFDQKKFKKLPAEVSQLQFSNLLLPTTRSKPNM